MRTLGQRRAAYCLERLEGLQDDIREEFKKLTAGLPAMILQNGFGQTLAFLLAKNDDKHLAAFDIIAGWLRQRDLVGGARGHDTAAGRLAVVQGISGMEQDQYLHAQRESLAMLEWLKRYANADLFGGQP